MPNHVFPVLFMLLSTFSLSLTGLLTQYLSHIIPITLLGFLRFIIPALFLLVAMKLTHFRWPQRNMWFSLLIRAVCIAGSQLCFIYALQSLSLVESVVLFSTGPLFIPLLEKWLWGGQLAWRMVLSVCIIFIGVVMLAGNTGSIEWRPELLAGLSAGLFNAGSQLSLYRAAQSDMRSIEIHGWTFLVAALLLSPLLLLVPWSSDVGASLGMSWDISGAVTFAALLLSAILVVNTQVFRAKAYRLAKSGSQLAPLIFTNLLFSALWQVLFFDVDYTLAQQVGLAVIIVTTVINGILPRLTERKNRLKAA
ncbi:DMT family transporter [Vibrio cholerae]|uniref:DMT family transporter n=1 Tax=Vibrio cholerae TaxID=666 RepID=UPI0011D721CA|nr:DMT family transporter [Vibrio cholerae]EGR4442065.1 DMT family transporter [Vibrio cholerae]TXY85456.1 DMT family transporter [Vibrio cholerae]GHX41267.1 EamA family transporter [Vibrio cholerae]GIC15182.1 EamA family transporter [Vibrio cholerae]HDL8943347.1 DMT family transporter [Vibrio cholerae]